MDSTCTYLHDALGLLVRAKNCDVAKRLPLFLRSAAKYQCCCADGADFVIACMPAGTSLPEIKRVQAESSRRLGVPVAVSVPELQSRQRKALVAQKVPFVVPGIQAYLPFIGMAATARKNVSAGASKLVSDGENAVCAELSGAEPLPIGVSASPVSTSAQASAVCLASSPGCAATLREISERLGLSQSSVSRGISELAQRGIAHKSKSGRTVHVELPGGKIQLLTRHYAEFCSPVLRAYLVRTTPSIERLPYAGESALAIRSSMNPPRIPVRAASRLQEQGLRTRRVFDGEIPTQELTRLEVWKYGPVFNSASSIDDVSLALSLRDVDDERIQSALERLLEG